MPTPLEPEEVSRLVDLTMERVGDLETWLAALTLVSARTECERRELPLSGGISALKQRLRRYYQGNEGEELRANVAEGTRSLRSGRELGPIPAAIPEDRGVEFGGVRRRGRGSASHTVRDRAEPAASGPRASTPEYELPRGEPYDLPRADLEQPGVSRAALERPYTPRGDETPEPRRTNETRYRDLWTDGDGYVAPRREESRSGRRHPGRGVTTAQAYDVIRRWGLRFSGNRGSDADDFLERIREGREIVDVADEDLLKCLPFFLDGIALTWYRVTRAQWYIWEDFEDDFRRRFGAPNFQSELREDIRRRTQGEEEAVADYLSCMRGLFTRLQPPWPMTEQLDCAFRNLLPRYQLLLRREEINDFRIFEMAAQRIELGYSATRRYVAPPPPESMVCPSLAYQRVAGTRRAPRRHTELVCPVTGLDVTEPDYERRRFSRSPADEPGRRADPSRDKERQKRGEPRETSRREPAYDTRRREKDSRASQSREFERERPVDRRPLTERGPPQKTVCWNCGKEGHFSRNCTEGPRRHCYRCGRRDHTLRTCPSCQGNGQ